MTSADLLRLAGLVVLGSVDAADGVTPRDAWDLVVRGDDPAVVVADGLAAVDEAWLRLTGDRGFFAADGSFLISPTGTSAAPWWHVRPGPEFRLAEVLVGNPGEPEFVTMSTDGRSVCGVTTEEHGVWILWREPYGDIVVRQVSAHSTVDGCGRGGLPAAGAPRRQVRALLAQRAVVAVAGVEPGVVRQDVEDAVFHIIEQRREIT